MLNGGNFRLDGGAMHGVVPKTLWSKLVSCDALNRCEYTTRCLVIEAAGKRVLVETGNGDKFSPKLKDIYGIDHDRSIEHALLDERQRPGAGVQAGAPRRPAQGMEGRGQAQRAQPRQLLTRKCSAAGGG